MFRPVDVAAEPCSLLSEFAVLGKGEHLKASAVGQYRLFPSAEAVEAAGFMQDFGAGTQIEMVGVAQNDLRLYVVAQFAHVHAFHGAACAHRHEDGGLDGAVVGLYGGCPCVCAGAGGL